jgi:hypothetical protein
MRGFEQPPSNLHQTTLVEISPLKPKKSKQTKPGTGKPYGFARWQVEKRARQLCQQCPLNNNCPIENFPDETK